MTQTKTVRKRRIRCLWYWAYQPYKWLVLFPFLIANTLLMAAVALVLVYVIGPKRASQVAGVLWARWNGYLTHMTVRVKGRSNVDEKQSYVIVSNHQSQYDIFVLYGWLGIDFKWVMKQELRKIPGLGVSCEKIGHVFIDRSNRQAAMASLNAAKERIKNGTSIVFFPEGTRSKDGRLGPFKKGAFRMALDLGLPLLPVTIKGTRAILPTGTIDILPGRAELIFHPPIPVDGLTKNDVDALVQKTKEVIASSL